MTDNIDTEDLRNETAQGSGAPGPEAPETGDDAAAAAAFDPAGEEIRLAPQPPVAVAAGGGMLSDGRPDQIPGFLRRCAKETSAQEGPVPPEFQYRYRTSAGETAGEHASMPPQGTAPDGAADPDFGDGGANTAIRSGNGFPTGARLRGESQQVADQADPDNPDWSNTARSALSELLTDIDNEQARRVSNRDKFAALAGKRRTTWPLTALIVSFLLVVVAYSVRNVDAGGTTGKIWRQTLALVTGPGDDAGAKPAPQANQGEPPATAAQVQVAQTPPVQPAAQVPVAQKKSTGLVFEPVKIVGPLGPVEPAAQRTAVAKPQRVSPGAAPNPILRPTPTVSANVAAVVPASPAPASAPTPAIAPSGTIALAPSTPVSPDKMPLAGLAISTPETAPDTEIAPRRFRRVASVSPGLIGMAAKSRVDVQPRPTPAPDYKLAAVAPQPQLQQKPVLPPSPADAVAGPDRYGIKAMLVRAEKLLDSRDVASARLLFERAASYGSAEGAFGAAKTYDPVCFEKLGVYGVPAEPEKAAALYQIAIDGGHVQAVEYLNSLNALRRKMKLKAATAQR